MTNTPERSIHLGGTAEDFKRGYQDALLRRGYRPNTVMYVDGYERGRAVRILLEGSDV